jgi:hypothetical protein
MNPHDEPRDPAPPRVHLVDVGASPAPGNGVAGAARTRAVALAEILGRTADQLKDSCDGQRDMDELSQIVERITHVAGALGTVYDHLAEWLYADGCPARHATDRFLRTADELRMAGASCRFAQSILAETLEQGTSR